MSRFKILFKKKSFIVLSTFYDFELLTLFIALGIFNALIYQRY